MAADTLQRLADFRQSYGETDLLAFLARLMPRDAAEFVMQLYSDLHEVINDLEESRHRLQGDGEAGLRDRVLGMLRQRGYDAEAEAQIGGHTDLLVRCRHLVLSWIGEAKVHSQYDSLVEGMKQLHTRYSNGRHQDVALLVFVFAADAKRVIDGWKAKLIQDGTCGLIGNPASVEGWSFVTEHKHGGSGATLRTRHIFALLHWAPIDKSATKSAKQLSGKRVKRAPTGG